MQQNIKSKEVTKKSKGTQIKKRNFRASNHEDSEVFEVFAAREAQNVKVPLERPSVVAFNALLMLQMYFRKFTYDFLQFTKEKMHAVTLSAPHLPNLRVLQTDV